MFKSLLPILLFVSQTVTAGTFSSLNLEKLVSPDGRAEYSISKYNPTQINWGKEINLITKDHSGANCGPAAVNVSRKEAINTLKSFYQENDLAQVLGNLVKKNKIVKAISAQDGSEGDSEYCSTSTMKFYSVDGEVLVLSFDFNT